MKIEGLKPTHVDIHTGIEYAKHAGVWYFLKDAYGVFPLEKRWGESHDFNKTPEERQDIHSDLKEIEQ